MQNTMNRRVRTALAVAASAALLLSITACTSGAETSGEAAAAGPKSGKLTIAFLQKQGDQQYFVDEADGAKAAAKALGDVDIKVVNLGTDANKAISEVDSVIAQKVDGIIIVVPDQQIGPQVISAAKAAGIPIMAADDVIKDADGTEIPFAGFDGTSMGNNVGAKAAELYTKAGWTAADTRVLSAFKQDQENCVQRVDGAAASFTKGLNGAAAPEIIKIGTDNSATDAQNKAGAVITGNSGVKNWVVWGCNDENETGVVTALQNAGVSPDNIAGVGLGAYLTCKDWAAKQDTGNKAALFISGVEVGKAALTSMVDLLRNGTALPAQSIADTAIVDASNWEAAGVVCT
jgi:L-arabinose transport system substrate-binding protein